MKREGDRTAVRKRLRPLSGWRAIAQHSRAGEGLPHASAPGLGLAHEMRFPCPKGECSQPASDKRRHHGLLALLQ